MGIFSQKLGAYNEYMRQEAGIQKPLTESRRRLTEDKNKDSVKSTSSKLMSAASELDKLVGAAEGDNLIDMKRAWNALSKIHKATVAMKDELEAYMDDNGLSKQTSE